MIGPTQLPLRFGVACCKCDRNSEACRKLQDSGCRFLCSAKAGKCGSVNGAAKTHSIVLEHALRRRLAASASHAGFSTER